MFIVWERIKWLGYNLKRVTQGDTDPARPVVDA
jgi:hypothetical protein